jgi:hypothetical protein
MGNKVSEANRVRSDAVGACRIKHGGCRRHLMCGSGMTVVRVNGTCCGRVVSDHGVDGHGWSEGRGILLKINMDGCGDAACDWVVDTVPWSVGRIADHDFAEYLFTQFATELVGHLSKDSAPEDTELGCVGSPGREEGQR